MNTTTTRLMDELPVVELQGVSDEAYPPRDKCFAMIRHMHRHFGRRFRWFLRADDDVYIRFEELAKFLQSADNARLWYMGASGVGRPGERGRLGLDPGKRCCMGGPGVVCSPFSSGTVELLRAVEAKVDDTVFRCRKHRSHKDQ